MPLHDAVMQGLPEMVDLLLSHGANVMVQDEEVKMICLNVLYCPVGQTCSVLVSQH